MGEIADDMYDRMMDQILDPDFEYEYDFPRHRGLWNVVCKRCGACGLKWRGTSDGWPLFENVRGERNRLKQHNCGVEASADDFGVITGVGK